MDIKVVWRVQLQYWKQQLIALSATIIILIVERTAVISSTIAPTFTFDMDTDREKGRGRDKQIKI